MRNLRPKFARSWTRPNTNCRDCGTRLQKAATTLDNKVKACDGMRFHDDPYHRTQRHDPRLGRLWSSLVWRMEAKRQARLNSAGPGTCCCGPPCKKQAT